MVRSFVLSVALATAAAAPSPPSRSSPLAARGYWLQPVPEGALEVAVHDTVTDPALAGTPQAAHALRDLAAQHPEGAAAGLARLGAGLLLLDHQQYAEAEPLLLDPEIAKTHLEDHAGKALADLYEKTGDFTRAAEQYDKLVARPNPDPFRCAALLRGAEVHDVLKHRDQAVEMIQRVLAECPGREPQALLQLGAVQEQRGQRRAAAEALDRLDRDYPASPQGREAATRLSRLAGDLPPATPQEKMGRDLKKALVLFQAGEHRSAVKLFQALLLRKPPPADADVIHVRLGRALLEIGKRDDAARVNLAAVKKGSAVEPEAAYFLARLQARRASSPAAFGSVATHFPGTSWGEEALLDGAAFYARSGKDEEALPFYRRIYEGYPQGKYIDPATFRVAFAEYRAARYDKAAEMFEAAAKTRGSNLWRPAYLYWAGRARREMGEEDRARALFEEVLAPLQVRLPRHPRARGAGPPARGRIVHAPRAGGRPRRRARALPHARAQPAAHRAAGRGDGRARLRAPEPDRAGDAQLDLLAAGAAAAGHHGHEARLSGVRDGDRRLAAGRGLADPVPHPVHATCSTTNAGAAGVDPALVAAVIQQESTFDPRRGERRWARTG